MRLDDVKSMLGSHPLVGEVDELSNGNIRIQTEFLYPDGNRVDVFVPIEPLSLTPTMLTDFGQTIEMLLDVQVKPWQSKKRQRMLEDAIKVLGISQIGGELRCDLPAFDRESISLGVIRLGQACLRVSDLVFTRQLNRLSTFSDTVEDVIVDAGFNYESEPKRIGVNGTPVQLDFLVFGQRTTSSILAMSTAYTSVAHNQAVDFFARWHDLGAPGHSERNVTIFDDTKQVYKDADLKRLETVSLVLPISDRETIREVLAA